MADKEIKFLVTAVDAVTEKLRGIKDEITGFGSHVTSIFQGIAATVVGVALGEFFRSAVEEGAKAEEGMNRLAAAVATTGNSYATMQPQLEAAVKGVEQFSVYTGAELRDALTNLIARTGDLGGSMKNLGLVAEIAAFKHQDLATASDFLAKIMNGNLNPLMKQFGIHATDSAEAIRILGDRFKGFAEAEAAGLHGVLAVLSRDWTELKEAVGLAIAGGDDFKATVTGLSAKLVDLQDWVKQNEGAIGGFASTLVSAIPGAVEFGFKVAEVFAAVGGAVRWLIEQGGELGARWLQLFGSIVETLGEWGVATKDFLKKFGIDLGDGISESMAKSGARMKEQGAQDIRDLRNTYQVESDTINKNFRDSYAGAESDLAIHHTKKNVLTNAQIAEEKKGAAEVTAAVEAIQKLSYEAQLKLLDAHTKAMTELQSKFMDEIKKLEEGGAKGHIDVQQQVNDALAALLIARGEMIRQYSDKYVKSVEALTPPTAAHLEIVRDLTNAHGDMRVKLDASTQASRDEADQAIAAALKHEQHRQAVIADATALANAASDAGKLAGAFRGLSPDLDEIIGKFQGLTDGVSGIASGIAGIVSGTDVMGGLMSGIGGIVSLINTFTGESQSARNVRVALENTIYELEVHRRTLGDLIAIQSPGRDIAGVQSALGEFLPSFVSSAANPFRVFNEQPLDVALAKHGLSIADLDAVAKQFNVNIRPNGYLDTRLLRQLLALIPTFDSSIPQDYAGQLKYLQTQWNVGQVGPAGQLLDLLGPSGLLQNPTAGLGASFFAKNFAGKTASQIQAELSGMLRDVGSMSNEDRGGLNLQQFIDLITMLSGLIRQLPQSYADNQVLIPAGASNSGLQPGPLLPLLPPGPTLPPIDNGIGPLLPPLGILPPIATPGGLPGGGPGVTVDNSTTVTVNVGPGNDPQAIAAAVAAGLAPVLADQAAALDQILGNRLLDQQQSGGDVTLATT